MLCSAKTQHKTFSVRVASYVQILFMNCNNTEDLLLFLVYINDLQSVFSIFHNKSKHNFTDNTHLIFPSKKLGIIESVIVMNHELRFNMVAKSCHEEHDT